VGFEVNAYPGEKFKGVIKYMDPTLRSSTRDMVVEATVANPDHRLRPGMFAVAHLQLKDEPVAVVPTKSVRTEANTRRLFAGCRGGQLMVVLDADSGKSVTTGPIGERVDAAAFDPSSKLVFMSNGGGNVSVYHEDEKDKYSLVETIPTNAGSKTMALDIKTRNLFIPANMGGQFTVLVFGR